MRGEYQTGCYFMTSLFEYSEGLERKYIIIKFKSLKPPWRHLFLSKIGWRVTGVENLLYFIAKAGKFLNATQFNS